MEACLNCTNCDEYSHSFKKCKITGYNLDNWAKKQYLKTNMNPCEGKYFEKQIDN